MNIGSVPEIVSLFRSSNELRPILFLGAGASFRSGVPLAADAVVRIAKASYAKTELVLCPINNFTMSEDFRIIVQPVTLWRKSYDYRTSEATCNAQQG